MVRKINYALIALIAPIFFMACEPEEIDGRPEGEWKFIIANATRHNVKIESVPFSNEKFSNNTYSLQEGDSIVLSGILSRNGVRYQQFPDGDVFIVFNDTLRYLCQETDEENPYYAEMINEILNYQCLLLGPDKFLYRYEITEKDYEYAKAHPYKSEAE
jgi:hypothetical protein